MISEKAQDALAEMERLYEQMEAIEYTENPQESDKAPEAVLEARQRFFEVW